MTRGQYDQARAGGWVGGAALYGYRLVYDVPHRDGRPRSRLVIHPEEAEVVRTIYALYADGTTDEQGHLVPLSCEAIVRRLNAAGHTLTVKAGRPRHDGTRLQIGERRPFETQDVRRILRGRYYLGLFSWGDTRLSKWVRDEGAVETLNPELQIVDVALWQRAQRVRQERSTGPRRTACSTRPLASLLRCPVCEGLLASKLTHHRRPDRAGGEIFAGYSCLNAQRFGKVACRGFNIGERIAREAVEDLLMGYLDRLEIRRSLGQAADELARETAAETAQAVLAELHQTETAMRRLVDAVADGALTNAEVRTKKLALMEKKARLEARLKKLRGTLRSQEEIREAVERIQGDYKKRIRELDGAQFRHVARQVFKHLIVVSVPAGGRTRQGHVQAHELTDAFKEELRTYELSAWADFILSSMGSSAVAGMGLEPKW